MKAPSLHPYGVLSLEDVPFWEMTIRLVASRFDGYVNMLELGTAGGVTAKGTKEFCDRNGILFRWHGCDNPIGKPTFDLGNWGIFHEGNFQTPEVVDKVPYGFNLILQDGCHCRLCCVKDFQLYSPKLNVGGFIAFHDTNPDPSWCLHHEQCKPDRFIDVRGALADLGLLPCKRPDFTWLGEQKGGRTQGFCLYQKLANS